MQSVPLCTHVRVNVFFSSLLERHQEASEADVPLPLAAVDTQRERLILEKDEEVRLDFLFGSLARLQSESLTFLCPALQLRRMQDVLERIQEQMRHGQRGGC